MSSLNRRDFQRLALIWGPSSWTLCGCGTLLHPERRHQAHNHQIDWRVAALDGLGLILFFVPGVVAFGVDFYTGAIYLPPEESGPLGGTYIGQAQPEGPVEAARTPANLVTVAPADRIPPGYVPVAPASSASPLPPNSSPPPGAFPAAPAILQLPQPPGTQPPPQGPLPPPPPSDASADWRRSPLPPGPIAPDLVEQQVRDATGAAFSLEEPQVRASEVADPTHLNQHLQRHHRDRRFGFVARELVRRWRGLLS